MSKKGRQPNNQRRQQALTLRLNGWTYAAIAEKMGITRQRVQQLTRPPREILHHIGHLAAWTCQGCGLLLGNGGDVHHKTSRSIGEDDYNDIANLVYLCKSCHRKAHDLT